MGCGLCAPRTHRYKSSAVSPNAQSIGKKATFASSDVPVQPQETLPSSRSRPESWRARNEEVAKAADKPAEHVDTAPVRSADLRAAADVAALPTPDEVSQLPGVLAQLQVPAEAFGEDGPLVEGNPLHVDRRHEASEPRSPKTAEEARREPLQPEGGKLHDENVDDREMEATLPALAIQLRSHSEAFDPGGSAVAKKKALVASARGWQVEEADLADVADVALFSAPAAKAKEPATACQTSEASLKLPVLREATSSKTSASSWKIEEASPLSAPFTDANQDDSPLSEPQVRKALAFPTDVEVSTSTQLMLLTWARWGRNSWRIKREEQIKQMQHRRFPRTPAPPREPLSPQPTPRAGRGDSAGSSPSESPASRPRTGAAAWRAGGELGMGTTVHSREGREGREGDRGGFALAELREEQRDSMAQQGARTKLVRALGGTAATAHSFGTPGFGVDTPGFPGASGAASADASVASSGVASPVKGGQMSPWILEAEALCEESEEDASPGGGWSLDPGSDTLLTSIEEELARLRAKPKVPEPSAQAHEEQEVLDEDELERVDMFEESPSKKAIQVDGGPVGPTSSPVLPFAPVKSAEDAAPQPFEYVVGETVSYYSGSHGAWMPARIVERKSRTIYVIDKQMRGCRAKVRASELVSEREEKKNPVLRAFSVLEVDEPSMDQTPSRSRGSTPTARGSPSSSPSARVPGRGRIVRDDFSDDSDDG